MSNLNFDIGSFQAGVSGAQSRIESLEQRRENRNEHLHLFDEAMAELHAELEELQVANEELRIQNEALAQAAETLHNEQQKYRQLYNAIPDACITTDIYGNVQQANEAACTLLNIKPAHASHKPLVTLVPEQSKKTFRKTLLQLKKEKKILQTTVKLIPRGSKAPLELGALITPFAPDNAGDGVLHWTLKPSAEAAVETEKISASPDKTKPTMTAVSEPAGVESNQEPEKAVYAVADRLKSYAEVHSELWSRQYDMASLLEYSAGQFAELTGSHCFISFLSNDKVRLVPMAAASRHKKSGPMLSQFLQAKPAPVAKNAAEKTLTSLQASFAGRDTNGGGAKGSRKAAVGMLMVPLRAADEAVGLLTLLREKEQDPFTKEEVVLIQTLADHLSLIVQLNRLKPLAAMAANSAVTNGQFLADLCAELQGPMHALDGFAAMVQEQIAEAGLDELQADANCLREAAAAVNQTLSDLLNISRLERADFKPDLERVSLREFVSDLELEVQALAGAHEIRLTVDSDDLASSIVIDSSLARQAVTSVSTALRCSSNAVCIEGICTNNHFILTLTCEEDLDKNVPVSAACTLSYSNTLELTETVSYGNGQRGVAMALAAKIVRLLSGELEVEFGESALAKAILKLPLN